MNGALRIWLSRYNYVSSCMHYFTKQKNFTKYWQPGLYGYRSHINVAFEVLPASYPSYRSRLNRFAKVSTDFGYSVSVSY